MSQINDAILAVVGTQLNDGLLIHYKANGATADDLQDAEREFLIAGGGTPGTLQDMYHELLGPGQLNDLLLDFWEAGGTFGPVLAPVWDVDPPNVPDGEDTVAFNYDFTPDLNTTSGVVLTSTGAALPSGLSIVGLTLQGTPDTVANNTGIQITATNGSGADQSLPFAIDIAVFSGETAEVQAVFDRMSALSTTEEDAIRDYVNGLVSDGIYSNITEIYAPCFNATDYKTGFKSRTLIDSASAGVHTPGQYVDFDANSKHMLESVDFDSYAAVEGFIGAYLVFTAADAVTNSDLFGIATAGDECYMRWRGNDTNDFNAIYNVTSATPRTVANVRPTGDLIGFGLDGVDLFVLQPGGIVVKATRVQNAVPANFPLQWHGQNIDGTPSLGNVMNSRYSLMITGNGIVDTNAVQIRTRSLQFLDDIGVTGLPGEEALGPELLADPTFNQDAGQWSLQAGWTISGNQGHAAANATNTNGCQATTPAPEIEDGKTYRVKITTLNGTYQNTGLRMQFNGTSSQTIAMADGDHELDILTTNAQTIFRYRHESVGDFEGDFETASCKEVLAVLFNLTGESSGSPGEFNEVGDWDEVQNVTVGGGEAEFTATPNDLRLEDVGIENGKRYLMTVDISGGTFGGAGMGIQLGSNTNLARIDGNGALVFIITADGTNNRLRFRSSGSDTFVGFMDNIKLREIVS